MSKYTNGPWTAEIAVGNRGGWALPVQSISISAVNALVAYYKTDGCEYPADDAENAANARLIAAAPELLEALLKLADAAQTSDDCCYGTLSTEFVRDIAQAAIAKATGEIP